MIINTLNGEAGLRITHSFNEVINEDFTRLKVIEYFFQDHPSGCIQIHAYGGTEGIDAELSLYNDMECQAELVKSFQFVSVAVEHVGAIDAILIQGQAPPEPTVPPTGPIIGEQPAEETPIDEDSWLEDSKCPDVVIKARDFINCPYAVVGGVKDSSDCEKDIREGPGYSCVHLINSIFVWTPGLYEDPATASVYIWEMGFNVCNQKIGDNNPFISVRDIPLEEMRPGDIIQAKANPDYPWKEMNGGHTAMYLGKGYLSKLPGYEDKWGTPPEGWDICYDQFKRSPDGQMIFIHSKPPSVCYSTYDDLFSEENGRYIRTEICRSKYCDENIEQIRYP